MLQDALQVEPRGDGHLGPLGGQQAGQVDVEIRLERRVLEEVRQRRLGVGPGPKSLGERYRLVPVCPETVGGLATPRPAAELQSDGSVRTASGDDVTEAYRAAPAAAVALANAVGATEAVLKPRSPSCGCHEIYDGSFGASPCPRKEG